MTEFPEGVVDMNDEGSVHMYSAKAIANYFLDKADEDGILRSGRKKKK